MRRADWGVESEADFMGSDVRMWDFDWGASSSSSGPPRRYMFRPGKDGIEKPIAAPIPAPTVPKASVARTPAFPLAPTAAPRPNPINAPIKAWPGLPPDIHMLG